jgi:hypothetical protein
MRGGRNNNQKAKEKGGKKKHKHKLPETPSEDCHSKTTEYERKKK